MIIKSIILENFETIDRFESLFDAELTVLRGERCDSVFKAIGVILKCDAVARTVRDIRDDTVVEALAEAGESAYLIRAVGSAKEKTFSYTVTSDADPPDADFYRRIRKNAEEERLFWFRPELAGRYSQRFRQYKDPGRYYPTGDLSGATDGIGNTRTFRACLHRRLKEYHEKEALSGGNMGIGVSSDGCFIPESRGAPHPPPLCGEERYLFEFFCFLEVNEFWGRIEEIRDLHDEKMPLLIPKLCDRTDAKKDLTPYLEKAKKQGRQIFIGAKMPTINYKTRGKTVYIKDKNRNIIG